MNKFKATYDALVSQYETVHEIAERIEACFEDGDVEGALALEAELNEAQAKADQIGGLYRKMVDVGGMETPEANFVPAGEPEPEEDESVMSRAEFDRLGAAEKALFVANGGSIQDEE